MDKAVQKYIDDLIQLKFAHCIRETRDNYESIDKVRRARITELMDQKKELIEKINEDQRPRPQLHVVAGDALPPGYNWLSELSEYTVFLTRPYKHLVKERGPFLDEYHVVHQGKRSTKLFTNLNQEGYLVVDPYDFCQRMELVEVIL
jgi:hypothetical protein